MKKLLLLLTTVMVSVSAYSQIKVSDVPKEEVIGEYKLLGTSYAKIVKKDAFCIFLYRDEKFTTMDNYKSFIFRDTDLDGVYALFTDFSSVKPGDEKSVDLEDGGTLRFEYKKTLGKMYAEVYHIDKAGVIGKLRWLTNKQFKKLFAK